MSTPRILVISSLNSENSKDLQESAQSRAIPLDIIPLSKVAIDTAEVNNSFFGYDIYIFRGYNLSYSYAQSLAKTLVAMGKTVIDSALASGFVPSKLDEALQYSQNNIPHPKTYYAKSTDLLKKKIENAPYPIVVKEIDSQKGQGVYLCQSWQEAENILNKSTGSHIAQEYIQTNYDIRVICVGDEVVGAMKRTSTDSDFRTNASQGGLVNSYRLTSKEKALALSCLLYTSPSPRD